MAEIDFPWFDLNELPLSPQSPTMISLGLEDFHSNAASFFGTNNSNVNADEEVQQATRIPELTTEAESLLTVNKRKRKQLTCDDRLAAYKCLLERTENGILRKGSTRVVAEMFRIGIRSIQRLWKRARESGTNDFRSMRVRNCGRKRLELDFEKIRDLPLRQRTTVRALAFALGVSKQFIITKLKEGTIRRHTNAIKPSLTPENIISRIRYCLSNIDPTTVPYQPTFYHMDNIVHIDEKWFLLTKKAQRYYLLRDEVDPVRSVRNANYIPKVMFLAAVARPRYDENGNCIFDGKIGIFPLVESVPALRSSQNRPRGTLEVKPITNITRNVIRAFMIDKVLPAIANKWPRDSITERIYIQQDNAKTHVHYDDLEFVCAVESSGLNVSLVCQPPNSPDMNVLDLGFFRAIQSLQSKECAKSIVDLIRAVEDAYNKFSVKKSNYIFLTLQTCMNEVLKCDGNNTYKIPHIKKRALARLGILPSSIQCPPEIYGNALALLPQ